MGITKQRKDNYPMGSSGNVQGAMASGMAGSAMNANTRLDADIWDTRSKFMKTIWLTVSIVLVPLIVWATWYVVKHPRPKQVEAEVPVPKVVSDVPRTELGNKIGRVVTVDGASKVVFDHAPNLGEMPEDQKLKTSVFFTQDGAAVVFTNIEYDGRGPDTVWHSHGKWYAILSNPQVTEHDFRFVGYSTPESCGCPAVKLVQQ